MNFMNTSVARSQLGREYSYFWPGFWRRSWWEEKVGWEPAEESRLPVLGVRPGTEMWRQTFLWTNSIWNTTLGFTRVCSSSCWRLSFLLQQLSSKGEGKTAALPFLLETPPRLLTGAAAASLCPFFLRTFCPFWSWEGRHRWETPHFCHYSLPNFNLQTQVEDF